jgi:hypothetical protein
VLKFVLKNSCGREIWSKCVQWKPRCFMRTPKLWQRFYVYTRTTQLGFRRGFYANYPREFCFQPSLPVMTSGSHQQNSTPTTVAWNPPFHSRQSKNVSRPNVSLKLPSLFPPQNFERCTHRLLREKPAQEASELSIGCLTSKQSYAVLCVSRMCLLLLFKIGSAVANDWYGCERS